MYIPFQNFLFRTPLLPVNTFFEEIKKLEKEESYWKQFLQNQLLQEAIFLASPVLYDEMIKFINSNPVGAGFTPAQSKGIDKMKNAVLRYYSRMCSRCTPFGLFAGFSMGKFENAEGRKDVTRHASRVTIPPLSQYRRYTRLDMHYLCALAQNLGKDEWLRKNVKYYPNSSLYVLGDKLRYVEYFYKNSKRIHQISSVTKDTKHVKCRCCKY